MIKVLALVGISLAGASAVASNESVDQSELHFVQPKSGGEVECALTKSDGGKMLVKGTSKLVHEQGLELLLFVNPQHPSANGWYLQWGKNGVLDFFDDGNWRGVAQLGDGKYPPQGGEIISLAVVAVTKEEAEAEIEKARKTPGRPRSGGLPAVAAERRSLAEDVKVVLKRR